MQATDKPATEFILASEAGQKVYGVAALEFAAGSGVTAAKVDAAYMDELAKRFTDNGYKHIRTNPSAVIAGRLGYEVTLWSESEQRVLMYTALAVGRTLCSVLSMEPAGHDESGEAKRFLASFQLLK